jgi:hypothetical protein
MGLRAIGTCTNMSYSGKKRLCPLLCFSREKEFGDP